MYPGRMTGGLGRRLTKWAGRRLMEGTPVATVALHRLMGYRLNGSREWQQTLCWLGASQPRAVTPSLTAALEILWGFNRPTQHIV